MMLTGGGALLRDLDRLSVRGTGLPAAGGRRPLVRCAVRGCGMALDHLDRQGGIFTSERVSLRTLERDAPLAV